jgi:hypothetical protein
MWGAKKASSRRTQSNIREQTVSQKTEIELMPEGWMGVG